MSDRDGIVLYCEPPVRNSARKLAAFAVFTLSVVVLASGTRWHFAGTIAAGVGLWSMLGTPEKVRFRARRIELRWFLYRRDVRYTDLAGYLVEPNCIVLRLRDGRSISLRTHPAEPIVREALLVMLRAATGLAPDGTEPTKMPEPTPALDHALRRAGRIATSRRARRIDSEDFIAALLCGPEREFLVRAGLRSPVSRDADDYREPGADLPPSPLFVEVLASARLAAAQHGRSEIAPNHVLLELYREGDPAVDPLIAAGLTPMRFVDALEHGLTPAESDARAFGTLTDAELLRGVDGDEVTLVIINDDLTPRVVLIDVINDTSLCERFESPAQLEELVDRIAREGRAHIDGISRDDAAALAIAMMQHARSLGSPLLVAIEP